MSSGGTRRDRPQVTHHQRAARPPALLFCFSGNFLLFFGGDDFF
jgi:hypothetical protein